MGSVRRAHVMSVLTFSHTGPDAVKDSTLDLMLNCHIPTEIFNNLLTRGPVFSFCTGLCKLCSSLVCEYTSRKSFLVRIENFNRAKFLVLGFCFVRNKVTC